MGGEESGPKLTQKILRSPISEKLQESTLDTFSINEFKFLAEKNFQDFFDHKGPPCVSSPELGQNQVSTHRGTLVVEKISKFFSSKNQNSLSENPSGVDT